MSRPGPLQRQYVRTAYARLPGMFLRRVVCGRDPYWRQCVLSRWGILPREVEAASRRQPTLWIDALSGGEVTQSVTFCRKLREALPGWHLVLSTHNRYSFEFARATLAVDHVIDVPWDFAGPHRRARRRIRPAMLVCIQNPTCAALVADAHAAGVPVVVVGAPLSADYRDHPMFARVLELNPIPLLDRIGVRSQADAEQYIATGADPSRVTVTGNMKYDFEYLRVDEAERAAMCRRLGIAPDAPVLVAASVHEVDTDLVVDGFLQARSRRGDLRLIVAPRYDGQVAHLRARLAARGLVAVTKRALDAGAAPFADAVAIIDTFGELPRLYAVASAVFLGGSVFRLHLGFGQNPIEPLVHRRPLLFGPFMSLWTDITTPLKQAFPGCEVTSADALAAGLLEVLTSPSVGERIGRVIDPIVSAHARDVDNNVALVLDELERRGLWVSGAARRPDTGAATRSAVAV